MVKKYATYIFDLDGTLLNTLDDLMLSCNYALRTNSMPERTKEEVRQFVGNGVKKLMERAIPNGLNNKKFQSTYDTFRTYYLKHGFDNTKPYDGITELLVRLKSKGCNIAVVSNKFDAATKKLCNHFFHDNVAVAIGESEGVNKKPAPDTVIKALKELGVSKENAVYVGDSDVDIETAKNSGLPCISVLWGFRDKDFLLKHGATTFVSTPDEIG